MQFIAQFKDSKKYMDKILFNSPEIIVLVKMIIAHILSDFVFQTKKMVDNKKWISIAMLWHILIVFVITTLFSFLWWQSLLIAILHYIIDGLKISVSKTDYFKESKSKLFIFDQLAHLISILFIWGWNFDKLNVLFLRADWCFNQLSFLLIVSAYIIVTLPLGFLIGLATNKINQTTQQTTTTTTTTTIEETDYNGLNIGIFERIIILTFVILEQYEAIGFLIAGKSLLRFASQNEHKKSEYVLLGTMMSYAITIVIGVIVSLILKS